MKALIAIIAIAFSYLSLADTTAIENLIYDGSMGLQEINVTTEKTRTEYRQVTVPATCYRTEYRQVCEQAPPRCTPMCDARGICRNRCVPGGTVCRTIPVSVPYTCMRTETRSYQVHDYYVETRAKFNFSTENMDDLIQEKISLKVTGENDYLSVNGSNNYFILLENKMRSERMTAGTKYIDLTYTIKLVNASLAKNVLTNGIQGVILRNNELSFTLGEGFNLSDFTQQIRIYQNRRFGSDTLLLDKFLAPHEMTILNESGRTRIIIRIDQLGINLPYNKRIILDTRYNINESKLLNANAIKYSANSNWVFR